MYKYFIRFLLKLLPPLTFLKVNRFLFSKLGYEIDKEARVSSNAQLLGNLLISIGKDTFIGHFTLITGGESKIIIGDYCDISSNVTIISGTHELHPQGLRMAGKGTGEDIIIENGVWIGASATILPGITIGEKSVVAAGSVVTKNVLPYSIVAGNPAKVIKKYDSIENSWIKLTD